MPRRLILALLLALAVAPASAQSYRNADGVRVRSPHHYKRHPNAGTSVTAHCRDGSVSFSKHRSGTCSHHGGVNTWG